MADGIDFGGILGAVVSGGASIYNTAVNARSVEATNAQNLMMNTGAWKGQQLLDEASKTGLSPLALLGNTGTNIPMQPVTSNLDLSTAGQMLGRAFQSGNPADARMQSLREENLALQNAQLANDVVAGQTRNSVNAATFRQPGTAPAPPTFSLDDVWGAVHGPGRLAPKAGLQAVMRPNGDVFYIPSSTVQSGLWSPLPGLPANPQAASDVVRANSRDMPIPGDVLRSARQIPGADWFMRLKGGAKSLLQRYEDWFLSQSR